MGVSAQSLLECIKAHCILKLEMIIEDLLTSRTNSSLNATVEQKCMTTREKRQSIDTTVEPDGGGCVPLRHLMDFPNPAVRERRDDRQSSPTLKRCDASVAAAGLQKVGVLAYMGTEVRSPSPTRPLREWLLFRS